MQDWHIVKGKFVFPNRGKGGKMAPKKVAKKASKKDGDGGEKGEGRAQAGACPVCGMKMK